jgi:uncharacterized protein (DUF1499 family)
MRRSRLAVVSGFLGALGVFDAVLGPVLIQLGVVKPLFGFQFFFGLGLLLGLVALLLSPFALRATRAAGTRSGRGLAWLGFGCGALLVAVLFVSARPGGGLPPINDITTDLADPPLFSGDPAVADDPSAAGRDMAYPADFVVQVQGAYPDLQPIRVSSDSARALALAVETATALGWEVIAVDEASGTVLARETTKIFRFVDDVVIRVRPADGGGSIVDLRSKSRDGRGDLGANAARIRRFAEKLPR